MSNHIYETGKGKLKMRPFDIQYAIRWGKTINGRVIRGPEVIDAKSIEFFLNEAPFLTSNFDPNNVIGKIDWIQSDWNGMLCHVTIRDDDLRKSIDFLGDKFWNVWRLGIGFDVFKYHLEKGLTVMDKIYLIEIALVPNVFDRNKFDEEKKIVHEIPTCHDFLQKEVPNKPYKLVTQGGEYVGTHYGPDRGPAIPTCLVEAGRVFVRKGETFTYVEEPKGDVREAWRGEMMSVK